MKKSSRDRRVFRRLEKHLPECDQVFLNEMQTKLNKILRDAHYRRLAIALNTFKTTGKIKGLDIETLFGVTLC